MPTLLQQHPVLLILFELLFLPIQPFSGLLLLPTRVSPPLSLLFPLQLLRLAPWLLFERLLEIPLLSSMLPFSILLLS